MRIVILLALVLVAACSVNTERVKEPGPQQNSSKAQTVLALAEKQVEMQNAMQPNSWDVSLEESMAKENPLTPPKIVLNSGLPPTRYPGNVGLWNCQKLERGSSLCHLDSWKHMSAEYFNDETTGKYIGRVVILGAPYQGLTASCEESGGVTITISSPYLRESYYKGTEFEVGFDGEPWMAYKFSSVDQSVGVVRDTKSLFDNLMKDFSNLEIRTLPANSANTDKFQFVVKNFPKAWAVACGWHMNYDPVTGIRPGA